MILFLLLLIILLLLFLLNRQVIERQSLNGSVRETVLNQEINNCQGLAIDWMARNLYWADEGLSRIYVARLSNVTQRKILVHGVFFHPRSLVLNPQKGYF